MIKSLLIANRGEIACRIIRTCHALNIRCIAVFAEPDRQALHVKLADEAYCIGSEKLVDSYLNTHKILQVAQQAGADAIHPGYGFLSENPDFAKACAENQIIFIGPKPDAIELMALKDQSIKTMQTAGIPTTPGYYDLPDIKAYEKAAAQIGYPVLIKATAGGGGKGMRKVASVEELPEAVRQAKQESLNAFGNDTLFMEKYLVAARHIEVQVFRDTHGQCVHLFERDCSTQRRHQKLIEEAPAQGLSPELKQNLYGAAIQAANAIDYVGAGTVEFLVSATGEFYFMEMNTRLQVEHPVTEMITGLDLVAWQIKIAQGDKMPLEQSQIKLKGHAIEARIYSEDPNQNFLPQIGKIQAIFLPTSTDVRIDSGIQAGDQLSIHFDPMMSKIITWAETREQAIHKLIHSLDQYQIIGVKNNVDFIKAILTSRAFQAGLDIQYIEKNAASLIIPAPQASAELLAIVSLIQVLQRQKSTQYLEYSPWLDNTCFRINLPTIETITVCQQALSHQILIEHIPSTREETQWLRLNIPNQDETIDIEGTIHPYAVKNTLFYKLTYTINDQQQTLTYFNDNTHQIHLLYKGQLYSFNAGVFEHDVYQSAESDSNAILSPMPGLVTKIWVKKDASVNKGEKLLALEAMKMEHTIAAPKDGKIKTINYQPGDQVIEGSLLVELAID
tara:strand:- start:41743 stop:43764 length:2022 start_codon:yes stop_codon:yes gene_type:complete